MPPRVTGCVLVLPVYDACVRGCLGAGGSGVVARQASRATAPQRRQRGLRSDQFPTARGRARLVAALRSAPRTSRSDGGRKNFSQWAACRRPQKRITKGSRGQAAASLHCFDSFVTHKGRAAAIQAPVPTPVPHELPAGGPPGREFETEGRERAPPTSSTSPVHGPRSTENFRTVS